MPHLYFALVPCRPFSRLQRNRFCKCYACKTLFHVLATEMDRRHVPTSAQG